MTINRWTITQIKKALKEISEMGWIKSNRRHDTGIGKTLEDILNITENNIALPDFGAMELKSQRINTSSMMTLFTKSPKGITNTEIRKRFGYPDSEFPNIKILHQTIDEGRKNATGFHCKIDKRQGKLFVLKHRTVLGYYDLDFLKQKATEKIGNGLIMVLAETKKENGKEYFHYKEAYILKDIDPTKFLSHSKYDIRLGVYHSGKNAENRMIMVLLFGLLQNQFPISFRLKNEFFNFSSKQQYFLWSLFPLVHR